MLVCTTWKARPLPPEASQRTMAIWGEIEADEAASAHSERLCWYMDSDGSGVSPSAEWTTERLRWWRDWRRRAHSVNSSKETRVVLDLETAMPAITAAMERMNG